MLVLERLREQFSLSFILQTSLLHFLIFFLSAKNGRSPQTLRKFFGYSTSTSRIYPLSLSSS